MRLWTLDPSYLDAQGLVALWREALLARAVLRGHTKGYHHHPQLDRFRAYAAPVSAINAYLAAVHAEATTRGYAFDRRKLVPARQSIRLTATTGQLLFEARHLRRKLRDRSPASYRRFVERCSKGCPRAHPLFRVVRGEVEAWERGARTTE